MSVQLAVKDHPILFSGEMVRAILEGRKTQTRRIVRPQFTRLWGYGVKHGDDRFSCHVNIAEPDGSWKWLYCPYGQPGDRLWVKETAYIAPPNFSENTWNVTDDQGRKRVVGWDASMDSDGVRCATDFGVKKSPSIFMPRWASRITLEVVSVRVERVQEISEADASAEGVSTSEGYIDGDWCLATARDNFRFLWDEINGKRAPWASNPWVWVVTFKRVTA